MDSLHQALDTIATEATHHIVLERYIESGASRIALAPGTTTELIIDTPCFMALGADDVYSAHV
jgi:hypothetical protein